MPRSTRILFEPFSIGKLTIPGRVIKSATSETMATADGFATEQLVGFYGPMARAGTPLLITGNIYVSPDGQATPRQMGADSDDKIEGLARLAAEIHRHGSLIFAQLSHCGRQVVPPFIGRREAVSASEVKELMTGTKPRPLTPDEIHRIVDDFGAAALRCQQAGFDGVQIHAGHGYLVSQFLTPYTNRRTDAYGGALEGRTKFLRDIHRAIRDRVGADFPVILKINGSDWLPLRPGLKTAELVEIARLLERDGIDAVEVTVGHYESGFPMVRGSFGRCLRAMVRGSVRYLSFPRRQLVTLFWPLIALASNLIWRREEGYNLKYAGQFKAALSIPVICVGGFTTREKMETAIADAACDAVSCARAFIADPFLYRHLREEGVAHPPCVFCNACSGGSGSEPLDCTHPRVRREKAAMMATAVSSPRASAAGTG
jgi:2,4-dienoyl-CoA reductase-like NADH-dependent reductase (Old Yellow Enzyme family)